MAADSGMDTCPSPEIADSRKRPLDGDTDDTDTKRSHFSTGGDGTYHFKTLVPSVAAGAIIGKGGETIAQLQKDTGARVKMSKSHDFYPGTSERVCLITGSVDAIMQVLDFIMDRIREKPDISKQQQQQNATLQQQQQLAGAGDVNGISALAGTQDRDKQVKILVPNSTAGMIIGKAGNYIKQIKEETGSYVQISQKAKDLSLQERCITVIGDKDSNKAACMMILAKVVDDPQSGTCLNVSYADVAGPVANFNPTGSPYAAHQQQQGVAGVGPGTAGSILVNGVGATAAAAAGLQLSLNLLGPQNAAPNAALAAQFVDHIKLQLRNSSYSEPAASEICAALLVLARHGALGVGLGAALGAAQVHHQQQQQNNAAAAAAASAAAVTSAAAAGQALGYLGGVQAMDHSTAGVFGAIGQVSLDNPYHLGTTNSPTPRGPLERFAEAAFDPFRHAATAPVALNNNSFGLATGGAQQALGAAQALGALSKSPTPGDIGSKDAKNVEIAEVIVGAILGPGGRSLIEIQHLSGANIQISKKGIFAPGTRNRIVTIHGSPSAIGTAQYLIEQRIAEEEVKRARHNALSTLMQ
ncbi:RNA-binding protein Nova-1 isoform X2 [Ctenocephalides felis]|uniref:RNA-binding protein Nova-1 isoform X2 n=1 Tax=Ctenocephalides felis TaxID=7515 RepID=UPI000E6E1EAB|nr:RNA-binding protein Nova-1 isoform X2 [Ctenocephalides felis]